MTTEIGRFWIVCRDDKIGAHGTYRKHESLASAVEEARRLSNRTEGRSGKGRKVYRYVVMEAIGGFTRPYRGEVEEVKVND